MSGPRLVAAALRLVYIVDTAGAADGARVDAVLGHGATAVWLREPGATGRALYDAAGSLLLRCRRLGAVLVVGDRADVAMAVGADGVQLGHRSPPARSVRPWVRGWMGVSCHTASEVAAAEEAGADYVVVSPVFGVPDKGAPLGVDGLSALSAVAHVPVVALGGITGDNVGLLRGEAVAGVAVIRSLRDAPDPAAAARRLSAR
ncbi:MAG: thiamine phosphate synthase [Planctomycetota bacterium]